jgi:DNA-binding LacI/PurR family transcriptional regulator
MSRTKGVPAGGTVTLRQVAEAAGVSTATASRVLNGVPGKANAETVARVRGVAAPHFFARANNKITNNTKKKKFLLY